MSAACFVQARVGGGGGAVHDRGAAVFRCYGVVGECDGGVVV